MQPEKIKDLILTGMNTSEVFVEGDGSHFTAVVVSPDFIGKTRLQKQQMVYTTVQQPLLEGHLHALSLKTLTPQEWQDLKEMEGNIDGKIDHPGE